MSFLAKSIQSQGAVRALVSRSGDEELQKAAGSRAAKVKEALAAAGEDVSDADRRAIFADPEKWLEEHKKDSDGDEE